MRVADGDTLRIVLRVSFGDEYHRSGILRGLLKAVVTEFTTRHTLQQIDKVRINTQHHRLRLRVAHAAIVFDDVGIASDIH